MARWGSVPIALAGASQHATKYVSGEDQASARLLSFSRDVHALRAFFVVAGGPTVTNKALVAAAGSRFARASLICAEQLQSLATARDFVLGRLDVCRSLDGVERGLTELQEFEDAHEGVAVLNPAGALFTCHDKIATALALRTAGIPHPQTACVDHLSQLAGVELPVIVKPRLGVGGSTSSVARHRSS